jgi:hypothetical protein
MFTTIVGGAHSNHGLCEMGTNALCEMGTNALCIDITSLLLSEPLISCAQNAKEKGKSGDYLPSQSCTHSTPILCATPNNTYFV